MKKEINESFRRQNFYHIYYPIEVFLCFLHPFPQEKDYYYYEKRNYELKIHSKALLSLIYQSLKIITSNETN